MPWLFFLQKAVSLNIVILIRLHNNTKGLCSLYFRVVAVVHRSNKLARHCSQNHTVLTNCES